MTMAWVQLLMRVNNLRANDSSALRKALDYVEISKGSSTRNTRNTRNGL